jgi:hypothetical protein
MKPYIEIYYRALDAYRGAERVCIPLSDLYTWLEWKTHCAQELAQQLTIISVRYIESPSN